MPKRETIRVIEDLGVASLTHNLIFLIRDKQLVEFLKENSENISLIMYEEKFITKHQQLPY